VALEHWYDLDDYVRCCLAKKSPDIQLLSRIDNRFHSLTNSVAWYCTEFHPGGDPTIFQDFVQLILRVQGDSDPCPSHWDVKRAIDRACYVIQRIEATILSRADSDTLPAAVQGAGDPSHPSAYVPKSGTREAEILQALVEAQAFNKSGRVTTATLAKKCGGPRADPINYKQPVTTLHKQGLVDTLAAPGGGCWLTRPGRTAAASIMNR
jgi:hypothetical protein